jgi:hypothetical protein
MRRARHYRARLAAPEFHMALKRLRDSRDKVIAHNEHVDPSVRLRPTWDDAARLTAFAAEFTQVMAWGYLSLDLTIGGEFVASFHAQRSARTLVGLLHRAGLDVSAA